MGIESKLEDKVISVAGRTIGCVLGFFVPIFLIKSLSYLAINGFIDSPFFEDPVSWGISIAGFTGVSYAMWKDRVPTLPYIGSFLG